jgi:hypothetical protein
MQDADESYALLPLDLEHLSKGALKVLAADPEVDRSLLEHILVQEKHDPELIRCLIRNPSLPDEAFETIGPHLTDELRQEIAARDKALAAVADALMDPTKTPKGSEPQGSAAAGKKNLEARIQEMTIVGKIGLALKGPREARNILIRNPVKEVALTVVKNPKLTDSEVELYASSTNVCEGVHREIGKNREWCKNYNVIRSLVFNPKTPVGVSLEKMPFMKDKDLQFLSKSRNVPHAVRAAAKRLVAKKTRP